MADSDQLFPQWAKGLGAAMQSTEPHRPENREAVRSNKESPLHTLVSLLSEDYTHRHALLNCDEQNPEGQLEGPFHVNGTFIDALLDLIEDRFRQTGSWSKVWGLPEDHLKRHDADLEDCIRIGQQIAKILKFALKHFGAASSNLEHTDMMRKAAEQLIEMSEDIKQIENQYLLLPYLSVATIWLIHSTLELRMPDALRRILGELASRFEILLIYPKMEGTRTLYNLNIVFAAQQGKPPRVVRHLRCGFNLGGSFPDGEAAVLRLANALRITTAHADDLGRDGEPRGFPDERGKRLSAQVILVAPPSRSS